MEIRQKRESNVQEHEAYSPSRILLIVDDFPLKNFPRKQTLIGNGGNSGGGGGGYKKNNNKQTNKQINK